jgi:hypothetical protein
MRSFYILLLAIISLPAFSQTSWKGTTSTAWNNTANWTNGLPTSLKAAILGDANFVVANQPTVNATAACLSLTIGGTVNTTLTVSKNISISGAVIINSGSTVNLGKATMTTAGSWTNSGTFSTTHNNAKNIFSATGTITGATTFRKMTVNANTTLTVNSNIGSSGGITCNGTLNPSATAVVANSITVAATTGILKVNAAAFATNYSGTVTLTAGCIVDYSAAGNQTISSSYSYSTLRISGSGTKSLAANLPSLNTNSGNIQVNAGTLNLSTFTATRASLGGTLSVLNGASIQVSGTSNFPTTYQNMSLSFTSTVEYNGTTQNVNAVSYGNLLLSTSGTKTISSTAFTVSNALTTSGTVTAAVGGNITVGGALSVGTGTVFNVGVVTDTVRVAGGIANAGTITGNAGTIEVNGAGTSISGAGTFNFASLLITASGVTSSLAAISISGNLGTTGSGVFTHSSGTITMSGTGKTISGSNITLTNLTVNGTVTTSAGFSLAGNLSVSGTLSTAGILLMTGASKIISGAGGITFASLSITGSITTASSFFVSGTLDVSGTFSASAGTVTFNSVGLFNGTASLNNITLAGTSLQMAANSTMNIAGAFTISAGSFDATTRTPNTVNYNSASTQNITGTTYDNLTISGGSTKTATGAVSTNSDLTIASSTTFAASTFSHIVKGNWVNSGAFTAGSSTVSFTGVNDATLTGATTFFVMTVNKTNATNSLFLANNMTTPTLNMTNGVMRTSSNKITVAGTGATGVINFTNPSSILGTIERTNTSGFSSATDYAFESANTFINFTGASGITGITVTVTQANVTTFPFGGAINRSYAISLAAGSYTSAKLRLHYEDAELNGNTEAGLTLWRYNGSSWVDFNALSRSSSLNYVDQTALTTVTGTWTHSVTSTVVTWNGSASTDWNNPANWTITQGAPSTPPSSSDVVQLGTAAFTFQPKITSAATAKNILFGSAQAVILTMDPGGSLTTQGNISGSWSGNATHSIIVGAQTLTVNGSVLLSDGTASHAIDLSIGTGTLALTGSLTESGGANISFSGAGNLTIGGDFTYTSGTFSAGTGTVTYNGANFQAVGGVSYNQLVINKSAATATAGATTTVNGDLTVTAGTFDFSGPTTLMGNVNVSSGAFATNRTSITVAGNWNNSGTYIPNGGQATFNGTGTQTVSATAFNKIIVNKASGTLQLTGNITLNSDFLINSGTVDLGSFTANRNTIGGTLQLDNATALLIGGTGNFPTNYTNYTFGATSTTTYNGAGTQSIGGITYGHLVLSNGGSNAKTLAAAATVAGDLTINSGATLGGGTSNLSLAGNWTNSGSFVPGTGAVLLIGTTKTVTGATIFNKLSIYGSYTVNGSNTSYNDKLTIVSGGSYDAGNGTALVYGDLTNSGTLTSTGTTTFMGTQVQNISLVNAINSTSTGIINFNGTIAPVLNSTSTPTFATLNINNTGGIAPSVNWTVGIAMNIASGATFTGGASTHTIAGNFTNNGVVTSTGALTFSPSTSSTVALGTNGGGNTFTSSGTVSFSGSGAMTVTGTPTALANVVIRNTSGVSPSSGWSNISGTFTIINTGIFNAGSNSYSLAGSMESNGTLNGGTSTFTFTSATAELSGSSNTSFYNLTVNTGAALIVNSEFNVDHDMTMNGTVDATLAGPVFTGSSAGSLTGSPSSLTLIGFEVSKSSGISLSLGKSVIGVIDLTLNSGNLDMGSLTITQDAVNTPNTLTIEDYARLRIGSTNSIPTFTQYAIDTFGIVEYYGAAQALSPTVTYGTLEVTSGAKTTSAGLTVLSNVTISGGSLAGSTFTHNVGGNWTQSAGGTFTSSGAGTVNFNGIIAQTVTATNTFTNITLNNSLGLTLGSAIAVSSTLTFTAGKIDLSAYDFTANGTISGASSAKYFIATGAGVLTQALAASGSKSWPVGTSADYMPATITYTAGSTADNLSVRLLTQTFNNGSSGTALSNYAVNGTWMISEAVAGGSNATVAVQWPGSREMAHFSRSTMRLAHYTAGAWEYGTGSIAATGTNPYTATRSGFTSFSPFSARMDNAVLPVTWMQFSGQRRNGSDELAWTTATETNNRGFDVQESVDGRRFTTIGFVAGAGNSTTVQRYHYTRSSARGSLYYRIRQADLDGNFSYTSIVRLTDGENATTGVQASFSGSNPVHGNANIQLTAATGGTVQILLHDAAGRSLWQLSMTLAAGSQSLIIPMNDKASGVYFITILDQEGNRQLIRLVKE